MRLAVSLERIPINEKLAIGQILLQDFKAKQEKCWQLARLYSRALIGGGVLFARDQRGSVYWQHGVPLWKGRRPKHRKPRVVPAQLLSFPPR